MHDGVVSAHTRGRCRHLPRPTPTQHGRSVLELSRRPYGAATVLDERCAIHGLHGRVREIRQFILLRDRLTARGSLHGTVLGCDASTFIDPCREPTADLSVVQPRGLALVPFDDERISTL